MIEFISNFLNPVISILLNNPLLEFTLDFIFGTLHYKPYSLTVFFLNISQILWPSASDNFELMFLLLYEIITFIITFTCFICFLVFLPNKKKRYSLFHKNFKNLRFFSKLNLLVFTYYFSIPTRVLFFRSSLGIVKFFIFLYVFCLVLCLEPIVFFLFLIYFAYLTQATLFFYFFEKNQKMKEKIDLFLFDNNSTFRKLYFRVLFYNPLNKK